MKQKPKKFKMYKDSYSGEEFLVETLESYLIRGGRIKRASTPSYLHASQVLEVSLMEKIQLAKHG
ncbi:MAG: hypothetical protein KAS32_30750 [Candidatus Peribacteraceae bacterium]|nr:hypothetical protein [Candidatus Peribacteraceae bacterium]